MTCFFSFFFFFAPQEIHICFNFLSEIPPAAFHHFSALTCLSLSCNNLRSIPPLDGQHLPSLRELCLSNNQIGKIENLDRLPGLECLELRCNQVQCIEGLASNAKLTRYFACCRMATYMGGSRSAEGNEGSLVPRPP